MPPSSKRPGSNPAIQSQDERDKLALERIQREKHHVDSSQIKTILSDEDTKPTDVVQLRYDHDPAFAALWDRVTKLKNRQTGAIRTVANETLELNQSIAADPVVEERLDEIAKKVDKHDTALAIVKWVAGVLVTITLGSAIVVFTKVFTWGVSTGEMEMRLRTLERDIQRLEQHRPRRVDAASTSQGEPK